LKRLKGNSPEPLSKLFKHGSRISKQRRAVKEAL
jgi:hypothetical protein